VAWPESSPAATPVWRGRGAESASDDEEARLVGVQAACAHLQKELEAALKSKAAMSKRMTSASQASSAVESREAGLQTDAAPGRDAALQTAVEARHASLQTEGGDRAAGADAALQTEARATGDASSQTAEAPSRRGSDAGLQTDAPAARSWPHHASTQTMSRRGSDAGLQTDAKACAHVGQQTLVPTADFGAQSGTPWAPLEEAAAQTEAQSDDQSAPARKADVRHTMVQTASRDAATRIASTQTSGPAKQPTRAREVQTLASGELPEVLDAEQRAAAAEAKAQACADATAAAEAELSRLWDRFSETEERLREAQGALRLAERKRRAHGDALAAAEEKQAAAVAAAAAAAEERVKAADARAGAAQRDADQERAARERVEEDLRRVQNVSEKSSALAQASRAQAEKTDALVTSMQTELATERARGAQLRTEVLELESRVRQQEDEARRREEQMGDQLEALQGEVAWLRREKQQQMNRMANLENVCIRSQKDAEEWQEQVRLLEREKERLSAEHAKVQEKLQLSEWKLRRTQDLEQRPPELRRLGGLRVSSARALLAPLRERRERRSCSHTGDSDQGTTDGGETTDVPREDNASNADSAAHGEAPRTSNSTDREDAETTSTCTSPKIDALEPLEEEGEDEAMSFNLLEELAKTLPRQRPRTRPRSRSKSRSTSPWATGKAGQGPSPPSPVRRSPMR